MEKSLQQQETDCLRIVLYGPESTGKTTLAIELAKKFNTSFVPEFAREYLQEKWNKQGEKCNLDDLLEIVKGQILNENLAIKKANDFIFCDTNILVTKIWSETHFEGYCDPKIEKYTDILKYDYYFLTDVDTPWDKDDLRDRPNQREEMFFYFKKVLDDKKLPYTILRGKLFERIEIAEKTLSLIKNNYVT